MAVVLVVSVDLVVLLYFTVMFSSLEEFFVNIVGVTTAQQAQV